MAQLRHLRRREAVVHPPPQISRDDHRRARQGIGEFNDEPLVVVESIGGLPIANGVDLVLVETQLTAECRSKILSPQAADQRAGTELGQQLEIHRRGSTE